MKRINVYVMINYDVMHSPQVIKVYATKKAAEEYGKIFAEMDLHSYSCVHESAMLLSDVEYIGVIDGASEESQNI